MPNAEVRLIAVIRIILLLLTRTNSDVPEAHYKKQLRAIRQHVQILRRNPDLRVPVVINKDIIIVVENLIDTATAQNWTHCASDTVMSCAKTSFSGLSLARTDDVRSAFIQFALSDIEKLDTVTHASTLFHERLYDESGTKLFVDKLNLAASKTLGNNNWSFWREWYQGFLEGKPLDWDLQRRVALIDDAIWEAGPEAVAEEIERIRAEYLAEKAPQAERIEFDHDTAKFRAVPLEVAKPDLEICPKVGDGRHQAAA